MRSLRARLLIGMIGSFALLLVVFGLVIDAAIEYTLIREFDFYLETVARTLAAAVESDGTRVDVKLVPEALSDIQQVEGELFSQYWSDDGTVVAKSANLAEGDLPSFHGELARPQVQSVLLPDGRPARAAGIRFSIAAHAQMPDRSPRTPPTDRQELTLVVARDTTDLRSHVRQLRWLLLMAGAGTMSVAAWVSTVVIQRSLRPLDQLAATIATIQEDDLSVRLAATAMPREVMPVVERLNELLQRLEDAFARERCLTADIAHELRTPVAGILSTAGVMLTADRPAAQYREAFEDVRGIARQMRSMIENLLTLTRLDSQLAHFQWESVELGEVVEHCWRASQARAAERALTFENAVPDGLCFRSDRHALMVVFTNLLENAVEYANDSGRIWIATRHVAGAVEVEVGNTGCELTGDQVAHVFDRFWRADAARQGTSLHVGLGLSLVRRIVTSLGGTVVASATHGDFIISIRLPVTAPPADVD